MERAWVSANPPLLEHQGTIPCPAAAALGGWQGGSEGPFAPWVLLLSLQGAGLGAALFKMLSAAHSVLDYLTLYPFTTTWQFLNIFNLFAIKLMMLMQTLGRKACDCLWKIWFKKSQDAAEH